VRTTNLGNAQRADAAPASSGPNADETVIDVQMRRLTAEGHGVQRHGSQLTRVQLYARVVEGLDPMTGTRVDGVHGGQHAYAAHATQFTSDADCRKLCLAMTSEITCMASPDMEQRTIR